MPKPVRFKILLILILVLIAFLIIYALGYVPILRVSGDLIFKKDFDLSSRAILNIQQNYPKIFNQFITTGDKETIDTLILTKMIENSIISQGLSQYPDSQEKVDGKVNSLLAQFNNVPPTQLNFLTQRLYQMDFPDAKRLLFLPQARYDVLQQELNNQDIRTWLINQEKQAKIQIFILPYQWNSQLLKVITNNS